MNKRRTQTVHYLDLDITIDFYRGISRKYTVHNIRSSIHLQVYLVANCFLRNFQNIAIVHLVFLIEIHHIYNFSSPYQNISYKQFKTYW